jgi:branched-chain amino acid transport system substrate-binding protein
MQTPKANVNRQSWKMHSTAYDGANRSFPTCLLPTAYCLLSLFAAACFAQAPPAQPYAAINRDVVSYNGPGRDGAHDLAGSEIRLGLLAPLAGPHQAEGEALRRAAEMAIDEENAASLPGGRRLTLVTRDESGPWGHSSNEIVHLVFDDQVVALITSTDGRAAHLAEQIGNKIGVPILTLSSDTTTTEINLPWIFRVGPTDAMQAQAFARDIYQAKKLQRVVLLTQDDHDSRVGGEEFEKAARAMNAPAPVQIIIESEAHSAGPLLRSAEREEPRTSKTGSRYVLQDAQAVVIWTDAATANLLVERLREALPSAPFYLCRKAAQDDGSAEIRGEAAPLPSGTRSSEDAGIWTTEAPDARSAPHRAFAQRYRQRFGAEPGIGAAEAYDAVRMLAASLRQSGPNRARLRDTLGQVSAFAGASGVISFDHAGNDTSQVTLLRLR